MYRSTKSYLTSSITKLRVQKRFRVFSSFYCNMICFTAIQVCNVLNNNSSSHMRSLTAYSFVSTAIGSVVISRERFEHELTRLAFKNIIGGPTLSEKDRHLCMRDERIRRDTCQNLLRKTRNSVTNSRRFVPCCCLKRVDFRCNDSTSQETIRDK